MESAELFGTDVTFFQGCIPFRLRLWSLSRLFLCWGKTVTAVEAIKQIEKTQASCHILACAPLNIAADLLCTKILEHVDSHKVYRMYATSWDPKKVPEDLKVCVPVLHFHFSL